MKRKDYHKGIKLQCYIPEEISSEIKRLSHDHGVSKTHIVIEALKLIIRVNQHKADN